MMTDLLIRNFAIIDNLHLSFGPGFSVLTGETGAGKSIIIDAVNLLLGGRARGDVIRAGAESAAVEAVFSLPGDAPLRHRLAAAELPDEEDLVVRRTLSRSGKNRAFINGAVVPVSQLRDLIGDLVNIYGQHEHQTLQRPEMHLPLLDRFAGLADQLGAYRQAYSAYRALKDKLERYDAAGRERQQRLEFLSFVRDELRAAQLQPDEDDLLAQERGLLLHAEKLLSATGGGYEGLYAGEHAACAIVSATLRQLGDLRHIDPQLGGLADQLQESLYLLEDVALQLRGYADRLDFEPQRQQQVEERLALLDRLKRKYAPTVNELRSHLQTVEAELDDLQEGDGRREEIARDCQRQRAELKQLADRLSSSRQQAAADLAAAVEGELAELAMPRAHFSLALTPLDQPGYDGQERGEFYLAANPGEPPQPLARIASGGELSRIMLALRRCAPHDDGLVSLIFDEVDAGIGGEAATAVGEKISRTAATVQVLCVTHLPQVAAFADHHYRVTKVAQDGRTTTRLVLLDPHQRATEMARMLGGSQVGEQALVHARELIEMSRRRTADSRDLAKT
ncbi:MAG: DNA repair protein RecN [Pelovirga sp.]